MKENQAIILYFPKTLVGAEPTDIGVMGGTFIEGAGPETPNVKEFDNLPKGMFF